MTFDFSFDVASRKEPQIVLYHDADFDLKSELKSGVNRENLYRTISSSSSCDHVGVRVVHPNSDDNQLDGGGACHNNGVVLDFNHVNRSEHKYSRSPMSSVPSYRNGLTNGETNNTDLGNKFGIPLHSGFTTNIMSSLDENYNEMSGNGEFSTNDNLDIVDYEVEVATSEDNSVEIETGQEQIIDGYQWTSKRTREYQISERRQQFQCCSENRDSLDIEEHRKEKIDENAHETVEKQKTTTTSNENGEYFQKGVNQVEVRSFEELDSIVNSNVSFLNGGHSRKNIYVTVIECDDSCDSGKENDKCSNVKMQIERTNNETGGQRNESGVNFVTDSFRFSQDGNENTPPGEHGSSTDKRGPTQRFFNHLSLKNIKVKQYENYSNDNSLDSKQPSENSVKMDANTIDENNSTNDVEHNGQKYNSTNGVGQKSVSINGTLDFHMTDTNEALFRDNIEVLTEVLTNASPLKVNKDASTPRQQTFFEENHPEICCSNTSTSPRTYQETSTYERNYRPSNVRKHAKRNRSSISCSRSKRKQVLNERPCDSDIDFYEQTDGPPSVGNNHKRKSSTKPYRRSLRRLDFNTFAYKRVKTESRTYNIENHSLNGQAKDFVSIINKPSSAECAIKHSVSFRSMLREVQMSMTDGKGSDANVNASSEQNSYSVHESSFRSDLVTTAFDCARMDSFPSNNAQVPPSFDDSFRSSSAGKEDRVSSVNGRKEPSVNGWCSDGDSDTEATVSVEDYTTSPDCYNEGAQEGKCLVFVHE